MAFFPKADAEVLLPNYGRPPPTPSQTVWPIYDPENANKLIKPWSAEVEQACFPPKPEPYAPAAVPSKPANAPDRYLRASLAKNERLRLSMLWYYTKDIFNETEFLCGLQEKVQLAQESTGWEFVAVGILDVKYYVALATVGLPLGALPRAETICAHIATQPPSSIFLLPDMMEDWRFKDCPYVESGGLRAYAGAPLRLQNGSGECVGFGSFCVTSRTSEEPLTKTQQHTLVRLADWVVSDIVQCARARRQRERRRMSELLIAAQAQIGDVVREEPIFEILRTIYPGAMISLVSCRATHAELEGREPITLSELDDGLWEDSAYIDRVITNENDQDLPDNRVVRAIAAKHENVTGLTTLIVASKEFREVFDDIDLWFVQSCANLLAQMWNKQLLAEVMRAKDKFLRGVSHQLRTPIHGILGSVELLAEELMARQNMPEAASAASTAVTGRLSVYIDTIKTSGRDLISIVNSLITLNQWADVAIKERCHDTHTIDELDAEFARETYKAITGDSRYDASLFFRYNLPFDCDTIRTDLTLLRDSVLPLILNAIQFTPRGTVAITTTLRSDRQELIVDVEDTGRGIQPDDQQRIFDPYEKVDIHSTGAGLGLTLASKFATLLNGSVALVSSDIDRGSHFRATFREIECIGPPVLSPPLASKLQHLPKTYYDLTAISGKESLLSNNFIRFLESQNIRASKNMNDSFVVLPVDDDMEVHRKRVADLLPGQVAICLVPTDRSCERGHSNIVYVDGPFSMSTLSSALLEAEKLAAEIQDSRISTPSSSEPDLILPGDQSLSPSAKLEKVICSFESKASEVEAQASQPATNTIVVPIHQPDLVIPVEAKIAVPTVSTISNSTRPTALLVDDNGINLRILQMYCAKRGLAYHCAVDGRQAVELFTKHQSLAAAGEGTPIELVLMDLQMPICDGIEATTQIRLLEKEKNWERSTLFIVTGQDNPSDREDATAAGADDYFVKPVGVKALDRAVKKYFPDFLGC